jgi:formamidopyrimidine-DNA glycosylase
LLDQRVVAGLGNIYVCEALFRAAISPRRLAASVSGTRAARLVPAIKTTLAEAIAAGGSSLRDYVQPSGELGYFQHAWKVYGREQEPCERCPGPPKCNGIRRDSLRETVLAPSIAREHSDESGDADSPMRNPARAINPRVRFHSA